MNIQSVKSETLLRFSITILLVLIVILATNLAYAQSFQITTSVSGSGGKITPAGPIITNAGTNRTFTLKPDKCYHLSEVKVDDNNIFSDLSELNDGKNPPPWSDSNLVRSGASKVYKYNFKNISDNHKIEASFNIDTFNLTVYKTGTGDGSITSSPEGINCTEEYKTCDKRYSCGDVVVLTAIPASDAIFEGWSGSCKGKGLTCTVKMSKTAKVTAKFTKIYDLTVQKTGVGKGIVTASPAGIQCGDKCEGKYKSGTIVKLSAKPSKDSVFVSWKNCPSSKGTICTITMNNDAVVEAEFDVIGLQKAKNMVSDLRNTVLSLYNYKGEGDHGIVQKSFNRLSEEITTKIAPDISNVVERIKMVISLVDVESTGEYFIDPYKIVIEETANGTIFKVYEGEILLDEGVVILTFNSRGMPTSGTFNAEMRTAEGLLVADLKFSGMTDSLGRYTSMTFTGSLKEENLGLYIDFSKDGRKLHVSFLPKPGEPEDIFPKSIYLSGKITTTTAQMDGILNISSIVWAPKDDIYTDWSYNGDEIVKVCVGGERPKAATFEGIFREIESEQPTGLKLTGKITWNFENANTYDGCEGGNPNNFPKWKASFNGIIEATATPKITAELKAGQTGHKIYNFEVSYSKTSNGLVIYIRGSGTYDEINKKWQAILTNQDGLKIRLVYDASKSGDNKFSGTITTSSGTKLADLYTLNGLPMVKYIDGQFESLF